MTEAGQSSESPIAREILATAAARHVGLDVLRVLATYMVMQIHTGEFYYIGTSGEVLNSADAHWVGWLNSLFRSCVPLFVMISGYFLFPIRSTRDFFRKRFSRVLLPFVAWCIVYALYNHLRGQTTWQQAGVNVLHIPINYGTEVGHLWFIYMLLGLYLFAPVLAPWIQVASRRSLEGFLLLWAVASSIPYLHLLFPDLWGEAFWNVNPMLYLFTGYLGYMVAAVYIRRHHATPTPQTRWFAVGMILAGYAVTAAGFLHRLPTEKAVSSLELTWGFCTINVEMIAVGLFLLLIDFRPVRLTAAKLLHDAAARSYGMYLAHIIVLNTVLGIMAHRFSSALPAIPMVALTTFVCTYVIVKALSYLPGSKWIVG